MNHLLVFADFPVEYVGRHESPNYLRVRFTGGPSLTENTPCPSADTKHRCFPKAGMEISARKSALHLVPIS